MSNGDQSSWQPERPDAEDLQAIERDVAEIASIQRRLVEGRKDLAMADRVAHQYQIAGGKVRLRMATELPEALNGIGLFQADTQYVGVGRISTGLGSPHLETNPDFLGLMVAFQTLDGHRVDFLAINDPTSPTDHHGEFMHVLHATAESAGSEIPLIGSWGDYDAGNLVAQQYEFGAALADRVGLVKAGRCLAHLFQQTSRTFRSSTAYQRYWTGIEELGDTAAKFEFVPLRDENHRPGFRPGERHLTDEWRARQKAGDVEFDLYWIPFRNESTTPTRTITRPWEEDHKVRVGRVVFPSVDPDSEDTRLWALLAGEMGANPGHWIHDRANSIELPATEFGLARKIAYQASQRGRHALDPRQYQGVFAAGRIDAELGRELLRRGAEKARAGHVSSAPR